MQPYHGFDEENVEVLPLVVVSQTFPARPSSIPDIRDFVNRCLAQSPLSEEDSKAVTRTVSQALLDAAGPTGTIQVSFRIFPDHAEVDVLRSRPGLGTAPGEALGGLWSPDGVNRIGGPPAPRPPADPAPAPFVPAAPATAGRGGPAGPAPAPRAGEPAGASAQDGDPADRDSASFADWMAGALRREGMTMEAAARQLGVSVKTVSRWVGGATEPRLRDLRRIREIFGDIPFP
jgi:hypothetical protein